LKIPPFIHVFFEKLNFSTVNVMVFLRTLYRLSVHLWFAFILLIHLLNLYPLLHLYALLAFAIHLPNNSTLYYLFQYQ